MAPSHPSYVVSIATLDQQLAAIHDSAERLARLTREERAALATATFTLERLRERMCIAADATLDMQETALRLRGAAVQLELAQLQQVEREAPREMFSGRFKRALDASTYVLDLVGRINASLVRERALFTTANERAEVIASRRAVYQLALVNAEWAFSTIGTDPDLAFFLGEGTLSKSERVRSSCYVLGVLLGVNSIHLRNATDHRLREAATGATAAHQERVW